jgi:hypothetical protein
MQFPWVTWDVILVGGLFCRNKKMQFMLEVRLSFVYSWNTQGGHRNSFCYGINPSHLRKGLYPGAEIQIMSFKFSNNEEEYITTQRFFLSTQYKILRNSFSSKDSSQWIYRISSIFLLHVSSVRSCAPNLNDHFEG